MSKKKKTIILEMPIEDVQRVDSVKEKVSATSRAAVFRQSIQLYEWMVEQVADGGKKVFVGEEGDLVEVKVFGV